MHELHFVLKIDKEFIYFNHRIAATLHILETWFVSGIQLSRASIKIIIIIIIIIIAIGIIIIIIIIIIIEFVPSQLWLGKIHLSWDVVISRIWLGGLICSLKSFLQLNMCQELQIFAVVYMYSGAS